MECLFRVLTEIAYDLVKLYELRNLRIIVSNFKTRVGLKLREILEKIIKYKHPENNTVITGTQLTVAM